jgi:hypothetical protein
MHEGKEFRSQREEVEAKIDEPNVIGSNIHVIKLIQYIELISFSLERVLCNAH